MLEQGRTYGDIQIVNAKISEGKLYFKGGQYRRTKGQSVASRL